jgi:hypothetical protein
VFVAVAIVGSAIGVVAPAAEDFDSRRHAMLEAAAAAYDAKPAWKNAFLVAGALFELGRIEDGRRMAHYALDGLVPGNKLNRWYTGGNSGFVVWPGIDCFIRYRHLLGGELEERFKEIYTTGVFYRRFTTSNHVTMAGVTRHLAVQTWGREAFTPHPDYAGKVYEALPRELQKTTRWPPSQLFANGDPDATAFVRGLVDHVIANGPGEYASRPYGAENTLPLLTLAECSNDAELKKRALIAYELTLLQLAPVWQRGHLATFAPRSYPDMESQQPWGIAALTWLYFGGKPPAHMEREWALRAATSSYRLPAVALAAGTDRSRPYRHRALFSGWALDHHVTPRYSLFSRSPKHALAKKSRYPFQGQSYPCGVMWDEPDVSRCSHLWITCPAADDNSDPKNAPSGLHTHGVTKFEQEVLHENALLWVFQIPADFRNPYVLGFVPGAPVPSSTRRPTQGGSISILEACCWRSPRRSRSTGTQAVAFGLRPASRRRGARSFAFPPCRWPWRWRRPPRTSLGTVPPTSSWPAIEMRCGRGRRSNVVPGSETWPSTSTGSAIGWSANLTAKTASTGCRWTTWPGRSSRTRG